MRYVIAWMWSFLAGALSISFLLMAWGAVAATILAIIGAFRGRCPKFIILLYAALVPICGFLFKAVFWISTRIAMPDLMSAMLFWSSTAIAGLSALFGIGPALINNIWLLTNGRNPAAEPEPQTKISGKEERRVA